MADNVTVEVQDGVTADIRTEDVGGVQVPIVKAAFGGDGVATVVDASNGLPTTPATGAVLRLTVIYTFQQ